ncbi:MAG: hypothetical protein B6D41_12265 [Chloroflexi bacterium UTCFX4]|jgi:hypothetical protein|nr:MAG: hypothetical protein B6D41_12265 [Chloroflexi bacterium UTCFX4]
MKCINCGQPTRVSSGYALPYLALTDGHYQNLYACSRACRDEWNAARREVKAIQAAQSAAQFKMEEMQDERKFFAG